MDHTQNTQAGDPRPGLGRITAPAPGPALTVFGGTITASTLTRTLAGPVVRYGVTGRTSRGPLKVAPGALRFPQDLGRVKLTLEHDRAASRGHLTAVEDDQDGIRAALKVADGPEGDAALREAKDRTRDGFSFDVVDATVEGDTITDALVIAIGQVGIPAYDDLRIDTIAASNTQHDPSQDQPTKGTPMDRLTELQAKDTLTQAESAELAQLVAAQNTDPANQGDNQPAQGDDQGTVQASRLAAVPAGVPAPSGAPARTQPQGGALGAFVNSVVDAIRDSSGSPTAITAALQDITHTAHSSVISAPAWSGELWSGLQYVPEWSDLFTTGPLTNFEGKGWRFTSTLEIQDYAGDKAAIPSDNVTTENSEYEAARMAVGVDVDRKFYDFPDAGFLASLMEQVRESWAMKLDAKIRAYTLAQAVTVEGGAGVAVQPTLFKAVAVVARALKRRRVGQASWIYVNDDDMFSLLDLTNLDVPAFLGLYNLDPRNFRASQDVPAGTVVGGVRQAATVRTLPGSPIRVSAQHLANGGIDEAFFGYWAIEEHHTTGIAKSTFDPTP